VGSTNRVTKGVCEKIAPNASQPIFVKINTYLTVAVENGSLWIWVTSVIYRKLSKDNSCSKGENSPNLGSMLWSQFSAILATFWRKIGVFLINQCYDHIFAKIAIVWAKNGNIFAKFFGKNISKNYNIGPCVHEARSQWKLSRCWGSWGWRFF
jgi:hypothetical protein